MKNKLAIYACSGVGEVTTVATVASALTDAGWKRNEVLRKYLGTSKDGGCAEYFLYIFIPQEDLGKYNSTIYNKRKQQLKTFAYVREIFVAYNYGTEAELLQIIRQGIEQTFGASVESVLAGIRGGNGQGIGPVLTSSAIAAIVTAVLSLVATIVSGIIAYCQSVAVAKYTAPTMQEIEDSAPAATDLTSSSKKRGLLLAGAVAIGAWLLKKS